MKLVKFTVTLTLQAPVLSQAIGSLKFGTDTAALLINDKPALPGSLIRGNLRESWETFAKYEALKPAYIDKWLGKSSNPDNNNDSYQPFRAKLRFDEYWTTNTTLEDDHALRYRIAIDEDSGTVKDGAIQMIDSPFPTGKEVKFCGSITAPVDQGEDKKLLNWLKKGFEFIPALGAFKGVGFGKIIQVDITQALAETKKLNDITQATNTLQIGLSFDRALCFAAPHSHDSNHFKAEEHVPGTALKAAIANKLGTTANGVKTHKKYPLVSQYFDQLRFCHALPATEKTSERTKPIPLSTVFVQGKLFDVASKSSAGLIDDEAPAFTPDWKSEEHSLAKDQKYRDWPDLKTELAVHTAIDYQQNTESEKDQGGKLFSLEAIRTETPWLSTIGLAAVEDNDKLGVITELTKLLDEGLPQLGKTKASAKIESLTTLEEKSLSLGNTVTIGLHTDARLTRPLFNQSATGSAQALHQAYAQSWKYWSDDSLELSHFYAQQTLVGGAYLHHRFYQKLGEDHAYNPELLTKAGSVFVLTVTDKEKALQKIEQWQNTGLPAPPNDPYGDNWQLTPYIAANGYGEIVVNDPWHTDHAVKEGWKNV
jgi:hypothetical protein